MINKKNITNTHFQTFYVSNETSNNPIIPLIQKTFKELKEQKILEKNNAIISHNYGRRIIINTNNFQNPDIDDFLEIVDYDPVKKVLLAIGSKKPDVETPIHWIIQHAKNDVNVVFQIKGEQIIKKFGKKIPYINIKKSSDSLDVAKEILQKLRTSNSNYIMIPDNGIFITGKTINDAGNQLTKLYKE